MTTPPPPVPYATVSTAPRVNPLALTAMILGIGSVLLPLLAPVAIVLGVIAVKRVASRQERGRGFAIAGIATGCVGIVVGVAGGVLLTYALQHARLNAQRVAGMSNLRQIGVAMMMYANENKGYLPPDLATLAADKYLGANPQVFIRPGSPDTPAAPLGTPQAQWASKIAPGSGSCSFTYVLSVPTKIFKLGPSTTTVLVYETTPLPGQPALVLFVDGHVEAVPIAKWTPMLAQLTTAPPAPPAAGQPVEAP